MWHLLLTAVGPLDAACSTQGPAEPSDLEWFYWARQATRVQLQLAAAIPSKVCCCSLLQFTIAAQYC